MLLPFVPLAGVQVSWKAHLLGARAYELENNPRARSCEGRDGGGEGGDRQEAEALQTARDEKQNRFLGNGAASNKEQPDVIRTT